MFWRGLIRYLFIGLIIAAKPLSAEEYQLIPPPDFHKQSFLNGMDVFFLPGGGTRIPFIVMLKNGAAFDPSQKWGVTYLTTWAILEQESTGEGVNVKSRLAQLGMEVDFRVDWDAVYFFGSASRENLIPGLNLLADLMVSPQFTEAGLDDLRSRLQGRILERTGRIQSKTEDLFLAELFRPNPYQHSVLGTAKTVENITLVDVKIQHRRLFKPNQARMALYFQDDWEDIFSALSRHWGMWVRGEVWDFTFRPAAPASVPRIRLIEAPSGEEMVRWGVLGPERSSEDWYVLKVFEEYLTLSLTSWAAELTDQSQIQASVRAESRRMPGFFQLNIQAPSTQLAAYLGRLRGFLEEIHRGEFDPVRLEEAKQLVYKEFTASLQDPVSRLSRLLETDLYSVGVNSLTHLGFRLNRMTPRILRETLVRYLSWDRSVTVLAGDPSVLGRAVKGLGGIEKQP